METKNKKWTEEETQFLLKSKKSAKSIAKKLGRSVASVYVRRNMLKNGYTTKATITPAKNRQKKKWKLKHFSDSEINFVISNRDKGNKWVSRQLGRKKSSIYNLLWRYDKGQLKIKPVDEFPVTVVREAMKKDAESINKKPRAKNSSRHPELVEGSAKSTKRFRLFWGLIDISW